MTSQRREHGAQVEPSLGGLERCTAHPQEIYRVLETAPGGVVIVEFVFQYPGVGTALVNAVEFRDLPVVQAVTMFVAGIYVGLNLLADLATILVTPKLRTAGR